MEKQTYIWYLPNDRRAHAKRLRAIGVTHIRIKAGGDDGRLWEQWTDLAAAQPYRDEGLTVSPWFYTWPTPGDQAVVLRAMRAQPFEEYALNPEVEWRTDSNANTWNTVEQANIAAAEWLDQMERTVPSIKRAFSSVPSWVGFPYEAWCAGCDQDEQQHYWPRNMLADVYGKDYDEVGYHRLRGGDELPCIPIITACQEYPDAGVIALAKNALMDFPNLDGFSSWESGNSGFQWAAMAAVYNILPEIISLVHGDDGQWARSWVGPDGVPVTQILWGGKAKQVLGTNFADIGISVEGIPSGTFDRSLITGVFQPWTKRTA
jgi:hypothetical protein